jgi:hypothetical protein
MKRKKKCQLLKHGKYIQFELGISHKFVMNMYTCIGYLWQFLLATYVAWRMNTVTSLRWKCSITVHFVSTTICTDTVVSSRYFLYLGIRSGLGFIPPDLFWWALTVWRHANTPRLSTNSMICFPFSSSLMGTERRHVDEPFVVSVYSDFFFLNSVRLRAIGLGARQLGVTAKLIAFWIYFEQIEFILKHVEWKIP